MKRLIVGMCLLACAYMGGAWGVETRTTLKIMPLGDSITYGVGGTKAGYRYFLERDLMRDGFLVDYLGTAQTNPCQGLNDPDHCGFSGIYLKGNRSYNIHDNVGTWLDQTGAPDIILLHVGTNDSKDLVPLTDRPQALSETLDTIVAKAPNAHVIVSTVLQRTDDVAKDDNIRTNFNAYVEGIVNAHAGNGENIHYLDLRACLAYPGDLSDGLHPNDSGYLKMANAWRAEIEKLYAPEAIPTALRHAQVQDQRHLQVEFTLPVTAATANLEHWTISDGASIAAVTLSEDGCTATLTLATEMQGGVMYQVTCSNVEARNGLVTAAIQIPNLHLTGRGYSINVPEGEWHDYRVVYAFTPVDVFPSGDEESVYGVNRSELYRGKKFDRVAYYMELQKTAQDPLQYVWVSFDAITNDLKGIGVPYNYVRQDTVDNMNVFCNVEGVKCGKGMTGGALEFWPGMYGADASGEFACRDQYNGGALGSMQIHNLETWTTMFSYNMWYWTAQNAGLGIGNCPPESQNNHDPDWTFSRNINNVKYKRIVILAHFTEELDIPQSVVEEVKYDSEHERVTIEFSQPVDFGRLGVHNFSLPGFTMVDVSLSKNFRTVTLQGKVAQAQTSTLTVQGVVDMVTQSELPRFQQVLQLQPNATAEDVQEAQEAADIAGELDAYVGASTLSGWELLFAADIPTSCHLNTGSGANTGWLQSDFYRLDRRTRLSGDGNNRTDRIAYCLVLEQENGLVQYAWTAMDAFTQDLQKMAAPELGYYFQVCVTNLDVLSNVDGVVNVTGSQQGIIEFTAGQYTMEPNPELLPTIGDSGIYNFDWNDSGFSTAPGNLYGCMQVHNWGDRQTVWAFNHFNGGNAPGLGIGNQSTSGHGDWTLANNAASFKSRRLYGFVKRSVVPTIRQATGDYPLPADFDLVDEADDYQLLYHWPVPLSGIGEYAFDGRANINVFDRVAYYFHLKYNDANRTDKWVWASMDAFTDDTTQLGIPGKDAPIMFRQKVDDMNVYASANIASLPVAEGGVVTGRHIATGNIEILPSMFDRNPGLEGLGGDEGGNRYDWNDAGGNANANNYGEWQVSNYGAGNIIFNIGAFYFGSSNSMGIGNNLDGSDSVDWTLCWNAGNFLERDLYVMVRPKSVMWGDATQFVREPVGARLSSGESVVLSVVALDATGWQWFRNGVLLKGATQPILSIDNYRPRDMGVYKCLVTTSTGASFTREAVVDSFVNTTILIR